MKRRGKNRPLLSHMSLGWIMVVFLLAVLINAALLTASSYLLALRTGILRKFPENPIWPLALVLLTLLFSILLAVGFGIPRIRPIHKVNEAMKKVSQGDFSIRLDESKDFGEILELIRSYNHMAEELGNIEMFRKDFINNFSHEFKTPIVSIRGFARQLERSDLSEEQRAEYAHIIAAESERLANMSTNILLLTKLENQQIITDKTDYALDEQLRGCILLLEKQWTDKEIDLRLELDPLTYCGNEEMMSHVWVNLIGNAVKYSPVGGVLEISCQQVQDFIVVHVTDHGEGMTPETQARIFEKFYQGDSAHAAEGNGLGLSLAKRIVDLCGGKIAVVSAPEHGSTFSVYLPLQK